MDSEGYPLCWDGSRPGPDGWIDGEYLSADELSPGEVEFAAELPSPH